MSIRSWRAEPSREIELDGQVWPVVTQDDLIKAVVDGAIMLDRAGGCLQVVLQRRATPLPNEMITVAAMCVWQDRTNAKPQPEDRGLEILEPEATNGHDELDGLTDEQISAAVVAAADAADEKIAAAVAAAPDELEVDESAVPEALRG